MAKFKSPQPPATPATNIQIVCQEPIIIPRDSDPAEDDSAESPSWLGLLFFGSIGAVLVVVAWHAPALVQSLWGDFLQQVTQWLHLP